MKGVYAHIFYNAHSNCRVSSLPLLVWLMV